MTIGYVCVCVCMCSGYNVICFFLRLFCTPFRLNLHYQRRGEVDFFLNVQSEAFLSKIHILLIRQESCYALSVRSCVF